MSKAQASIAARRLAQAIRGYTQRRTALATVTSVSKDSTGNVTAAQGMVQGLSNVRIAVSLNAPVAKGTRLMVEDYGTPSAPDWRMGMVTGGVGGSLGYLYDPGGGPVVTPSGIEGIRPNLAFNPTLSIRRRGHLNYAEGWIPRGITVLSEAAGADQ